jgi:hypothetical protein
MIEYLIVEVHFLLVLVLMLLDEISHHPVKIQDIHSQEIQSIFYFFFLDWNKTIIWI